MLFGPNCLVPLLLLPLAQIQAQAPAPPSAVLDGVVVDAATGAPLSRARVRLDRRNNELLYAQTDERGRFSFRSLAPGRYFVKAESPGFLVEREMPVDLERSAARELKIALTAYAVITGKVTDHHGLAMANCDIEILRKAPPGVVGTRPMASPLRARTDDRGEFRAPRLGAGTYYVAAVKLGSRKNWEPSQRTTYYPNATELSSAKPLELAAGQTVRADIQIVRRAGVRISGRILKPPDPSGPLVFTQVMLMLQGSPLVNPDAPFAFGKDEYELNDVMPGKYTLSAVTYDASTGRISGNHKALFGTLRDIEVGEGDMDGQDLTLDPLRDLSGTVTFRGACTPAPVLVRLTGSRLGRNPEAISGADGRFVLSGLTPARFALYTETRGGSGLPWTKVVSAHLGDRDVLKSGLEIPCGGDETLRIELECAHSGRAR
jgi:hypothetical protein